ncbi:MAG: T9SS type A sorting domain-containing protein [Prevotellaceae bacterium]|nr:T9SS type A sorting domain-containing protein [Prevotellaceae bacterium]
MAFENTWNTPNWGQTATWDYAASTDEKLVIKISNLSDKGWLPIALGGTADLRNYYYIHLDVFCNETSDFRLGLQRHYPNNKEWYFPMIEKTVMQPGKWYSIDYDLDDFFLSGYGTDTECVAHYLRFGGEIELGDYTPQWSDEIYITNLVLLGEGCTPTALGGKVIGEENGIEKVKGNSGFNAFVVDNTLNVSAKETIREINIINLAGQTVKTIPANALYANPDVSALTPGVYLVQATLAGGQKVNTKIIKNRHRQGHIQ